MTATIWVLLMVLITPVVGFETNYLLNKFDNEEDCRQEEKRIGDAMKDAYPDDNSFRIECKLKPTAIAEGRDATDKLLYAWLTIMYPDHDAKLIVLKIQPVEGANKETMMYAVRVVIDNKDIQDFLLFLVNGRISGWTTANFPPRVTDIDPEYLPDRSFI